MARLATFFTLPLIMFASSLSLASMSFSVQANDDLPPPSAAPQIEVEKLTEACSQIATEDQIDNAELPQFMLDCVNDQLTEMGYQRVEKLN